MTKITDKDSPESGAKLTYDLDINSSSTVQALALLRIGVFIPIRRSLPKNNQGLSVRPAFRTDVSDEFRKLEFSKKEGFENISIVGPALNFETDFKIWCGIVRAFNTYGYQNATIKFSFTEFAKMCGFSSKRIDERLRTRIHDSLSRIRGQTMEFTKTKSMAGYVGGLLLAGGYNANTDKVELIADPRLWELYNIDHHVLLKLNVMSKLSRNETAQCLYAFLSALPDKPYPISFKRLRERLCLTSNSVAEQNRTINKAIEKLRSIGFLKGEVVKDARNGNEQSLILEGLSQKLALR